MSRYVFRDVISHQGLNKTRVVTAYSRSELDMKINMQRAAWNEQWERKLAQEKKRAEKAQADRNAAAGQKVAEKRTEAAESIQQEMDTILTRSIRTSELSFNDLRDESTFDEPVPVEAAYEQFPIEPSFDDEKYHPKVPFFVSISSKKRAAFDAEQRSIFEQDHYAWESETRQIEETNQTRKNEYLDALESWNERRKEHAADQAATNASIEKLKEKFNAGDYDAVVQFYQLAIEAIPIPIAYERRAEVDYEPETKNLIVEYYFPALEQLPSLKKVAYVKTRNEFKESYQTAAFMKRKYESVTYQLVMRIIKCVSAIDKRAHNVDSIVLNGRLKTTDKATGQSIEPCILSVTTSLEDFRAINLASVDPKSWFKSTKGVSAASIANVTPVAPIMQLNREDKRFIEGYGVEETLDESVNLAAMDWQDFENLIRELFEEEFSGPGGEVKITQASRDGGVDAVAFDPDPLRGGKIVIQAKRYTNTVGISAVRDLYGTVMNEGAMKGILVTTSDFGNDAYAFVSDKPLTLINGGNLLYLLERHGHKARIDLKEAKLLLKEE